MVTRPIETTEVLVAATDVAGGTPLEADMLSSRSVVDPQGLVAAVDPGEFAGWQLRAPLAAGEPVPQSLLLPDARRSHPDVLALALDEDHAVLGVLVPGDRVDVYVTPDGPEPGETSLVAPGMYVIDIRDQSESFGADRAARLLLAVDDDTASRIIAAIHSGDIDLVRVSR
jgi:Flp pilus assembly protein CpaB